MRFHLRIFLGASFAAVLSCGGQAAPFAYISNGLSDTVSVIDTATNRVVTTIPVGPAPFGVAVTPDGKRVYVGSLASNSISVIDAATNPPSAVGTTE